MIMDSIDRFGIKKGRYAKCTAALLSAVIALSSCAVEPESPHQPHPHYQHTPSPEASTASPVLQEREPEKVPAETESEQHAAPSYIDSVVAQIVSQLIEPGMSEFDMAKAAFDYIIETTTMSEPLGLDLWRIRGPGDTKPSFVENRALSVLLFGVGMCEDYSAALAMLLRGMGLRAEYIPGLTFAADGSGFVNHAWTMVEIDGYWYHLDSQLEANITRQGRIRYRYFLRGDETMLASHRWGQNLIDSGLLTAAQNEEIARYFIPPPAPRDFPEPPPPHSFTAAPIPSIASIEAAIEAEFREFEYKYGPLEPLDLNIIPPVFALEGFPVGG